MIFVSSECLGAALASKDAQLKAFGCKMFFWYVQSFLRATGLAMIALEENLPVLLLSVVPVPPVHEQSLTGSHASNVLSKAANQRVAAMENTPQRRLGRDWMATRKRDA